MGRIIASSFERFNGGIAIKRKHGSSTVTRFYVYREEDAGNASAWRKGGRLRAHPGGP